jgi:hypothetical protein
MGIDIGLKTFPSVLFLFCAAYRFADIKSIGFASRITVYSNFFITKQIISYVLAFLYLALIILIFSLPE